MTTASESLGDSLLLSLRPPFGTMLHNPIEERLFESYVVAGFFALYPLVAEDFFAFGEELFVEERFFNEIGRIIRWYAHVRAMFRILPVTSTISADTMPSS